MHAEDIRKVFRKTPFRPVELVLNNGDRYPCPSPEIVISETLVVVLDKDERIALLDTSSIAAIEILKKPARRKKGAASKRK